MRRAAYSCPVFFVPESGDLTTGKIVLESGIGDRGSGISGAAYESRQPLILLITSPVFFFFEQLFWKNHKSLFLKDK